MQMYENLRLNLPSFEAKITEKDGTPYIYDILRKKWLVITPEEWVRQHFIHFLIERKGYPLLRMANEVSLHLNGALRRCDSVLYDLHARPKMIIEYKAPHIKITQKVFTQICSYNLIMRVDYLIVSNGLQHYCCKVDYARRTYTFLKDIPSYEEIKD